MCIRDRHFGLAPTAVLPKAPESSCSHERSGGSFDIHACPAAEDACGEREGQGQGWGPEPECAWQGASAAPTGSS
eukprot:11936010-Alexandrium_andersonii.AAC.1